MDISWIHGYLVVLQEDIEFEVMVNRAVLKAKSYIDNSQFEDHDDVRLILISPHHVVLWSFLTSPPWLPGVWYCSPTAQQLDVHLFVL